MTKDNIKALCLRFDLTDEDERKAYDHFQNRDKAEFSSYTKIVSRAVNEYFERRLRLADDPYDIIKAHTNRAALTEKE